MIKISVIIPVYNSEKYLSDCLSSVLNQTMKDIEIICINDGSTDNSLALLNDFAQKDTRMHIYSQENKGVIFTRNKGVSLAAAELIFTLDADDIIAPDLLEKLYTAREKGKGDIITCSVKMIGKVNKDLYLPKPNKINMALDNCLVNAALLSKQDFLLAGGYKEEYKCALEDYELWLNLLYVFNKKIYRIPERLFFYRIKEENESRNHAHLEQHRLLKDTLKKMYPEMKSYVFVGQVFKFFRKIGRFFYRNENNKIQICKIVVKKSGDEQRG